MKKKNLLICSLLSIATICGITTIKQTSRYNNDLIVHAEEESVCQSKSLSIVGTDLNGMAGWNTDNLIPMEYDAKNDIFTVILEVKEGSKITIVDVENGGKTEFKKPVQEDKNYDAAYVSEKAGSYKVTVARKMIDENFYVIKNGNSILYFKIEQNIRTGFTEKRLDNYGSKNFQVDETGRLVYEWQIWQEANPEGQYVDYALVYVFPDDYFLPDDDVNKIDLTKSLGSFKVDYRAGDEFLYKNDIEKKLSEIGLSGEQNVKFAARLIPFKEKGYSASDFYKLSKSYLYTVQDFNTINIAKGKNVVTIAEDMSESSKFLTDDNHGSGWRPLLEKGPDKYLETAWIYIDLGERYDLNEVDIYWESACAKDYDVYVSDIPYNGEITNDFKKIFSITGREFNNPANPVDNIKELEKCYGRYILIDCKTTCSDYGYQIFEVEVFANDKAPLPTDSVSLYGTQIGYDEDEHLAIRFIGKLIPVDLSSYYKSLSIRVTYTKESELEEEQNQKRVGTEKITTLYTSLVSKNGIEAVPEVDNNYYFVLLLTNVPKENSSFYVEILEDNVLMDEATYELNFY